MLKRRARQRSGIRDNDGPLRCRSHLQFVRGYECAIAGYYGTKVTRDGEIHLPPHECVGNIEAAHVRLGGDGGIGQKPGDDQTIPLCTAAHSEQHAIGEPEFEKRYGINMRKIAAELARISPALRRMRARNE